MREIFADDPGRISHALKTLKYAESIQVVEGGEPLVVKAAAILHDISAPGSHPAQTDAEPRPDRSRPPCRRDFK